jgi:hypothetical protein
MIKALVKRYVRRWLFERALYLSDEDLSRLAGGNPLTLAYVRKVYQFIRKRVEQAFDEW